MNDRRTRSVIIYKIFKEESNAKYVTEIIVVSRRTIWSRVRIRSSFYPRVSGGSSDGQTRLETARKINAAWLPRSAGCGYSALDPVHDREWRDRFCNLRAIQ